MECKRDADGSNLDLLIENLDHKTHKAITVLVIVPVETQ